MDVEYLEKEQRGKTMMTPNIRNISHEETLQRLNLHSLERCKGDMTKVYKWLKGISKGDKDRILKVHTDDKTRNNGI